MDEQGNDVHEEMHIWHIHTQSASSHIDDMDPSVIVIFLLEDLKQGNTMPIHFPRKKPNSYSHLLSKQEADSIPSALQKFQIFLNSSIFLKILLKAKPWKTH